MDAEKEWKDVIKRSLRNGSIGDGGVGKVSARLRSLRVPLGHEQTNPRPRQNQRTRPHMGQERRQGQGIPWGGPSFTHRWKGSYSTFPSFKFHISLLIKVLPFIFTKSIAFQLQVYTFGSYRLGVHGRNTDIDTLCVAPRHCERSDFFGDREGSFEWMLRAEPAVTDIHPVPDAFVPVIKLKFVFTILFHFSVVLG